MFYKLLRHVWFFLLICLPILLGCQSIPSFPDRATKRIFTEDNVEISAFDTNNDRQIDYWQRYNEQGQKEQLRFLEKDQTEKILNLDQITPDPNTPHFIIALDGVPFELVQMLYEQGHFRLFYPPSRLISCFPGMTDLAFQRIFGGQKPLAYEAEYFDRRKNRIIKGNEVYLSGENADWVNKLTYRCSFLLDPLAYLAPDALFKHELRNISKVLQKSGQGDAIVYTVATAGLGSRGGRESILHYLRKVDRFCEQIVYQHRGKVKITLLADHGHNMADGKRVSFRKSLESAGFRVSRRLETDRDVIPVKYGLVTYAAFYTNNPAGVADVLLQDPATSLACYPVGDAIQVRTVNGCALIRCENNRFSYTTEKGDPLLLNGIMETLRLQGTVEEGGFVEDRVLFEATEGHVYPDALRRIWQAFHGLVEHPADLVVCLQDGWYHGSASFDAMSGDIVSTHGSLNQINSNTFVLTMLGPLPPVMRLEEVLPELEKQKESRSR